MKTYILTDMEGVGGVLGWDQVLPGDPAYEKSRCWLTAEVNAAVEGALAGGAQEILILDGHGANNARNLLYEELHPAAVAVQGGPWPEYLQGLDDSFDAMLQIGVHAMAGTAGAVLDHTMSPDTWVETRVNGVPMGEIGLCAAVAGHFGVPLAMVSGDDKACAEAAALSPGIESAVVKEGIGRHCAKVLPMPVVLDAISEKARLAMAKAKDISPFTVGSPVEIHVEFSSEDPLRDIKERHGVRIVGPRTVAYSGAEIIEACARMFGR